MKRSILATLVLLLLFVKPAAAGDDLSVAVHHLMEILAGESRDYSLRVEVQSTAGRTEPDVVVEITRRGDDDFSIFITADKYAVRIERNAGETRLIVPKQQVVFLGRGPVADAESLRPSGIALRIISRDSRLRSWYASVGILRMLGRVSAETVADLARGLVAIDRNALDITGRSNPPGISIRAGEARILITIRPERERRRAAEVGYRQVPVDRTELERGIFRAVRRAGEVFLPGRSLALPRLREATTPGGMLGFRGPLRLAVLSGTPEEIGTAHGRLLQKEVRRSIDSTFFLAGLGYTIDRGEWFPDVLRDAWRRLSPHIPKDHLTEMDALADTVGIDRETVRLSNVFPELFHCSGFAVFGQATVDGKLYHGRVLDYMTMIGLQDAATVFVIAATGKHAFINVGYAGFIGSVTGMNDAKMSLGEMGGRGEGNWDGVPMATLMRRALEECGTLDEVIRLWEQSPRTCEYYYVFADGKIPDAVGVKATPDFFGVIPAGAAHPQLGEGIADAVVMSGGGRLKELRRRVTEGLGRIDIAAAIHLMDRPVAMRSNLHNALFVPQDLLLWVAHADRKRPAAECGYTKIDFAAILRSLRD